VVLAINSNITLQRNVVDNIGDIINRTGTVSEQCLTSPPTQYRLYGRRFLQVKMPTVSTVCQQYQSTEGDATKEKENNENN